VIAIGSHALPEAYSKHFVTLFAGHDGGQIVLWRLDTSSHLLLGPSHANTVCCLAPALTAKGDELLLSGSYDGCVSLWEPRHLRGVKPHLLARWAGCAEECRPGLSHPAA
jgi:WD40 repeat protein